MRLCTCTWGVPVVNGDEREDGVAATVATHDAQALAAEHVPDSQLAVR